MTKRRSFLPSEPECSWQRQIWLASVSVRTSFRHLAKPGTSVLSLTLILGFRIDVTAIGQSAYYCLQNIGKLRKFLGKRSYSDCHSPTLYMYQDCTTWIIFCMHDLYTRCMDQLRVQNTAARILMPTKLSEGLQRSDRPGVLHAHVVLAAHQVPFTRIGIIFLPYWRS